MTLQKQVSQIRKYGLYINNYDKNENILGYNCFLKDSEFMWVCLDTKSSCLCEKVTIVEGTVFTYLVDKT